LQARAAAAEDDDLTFSDTQPQAKMVAYESKSGGIIQTVKDMQAKAEAMREEIEEFYSKSKSSWKNILSFGDSDFERVALVTTAERYVRRERPCENREAELKRATSNDVSPI